MLRGLVLCSLCGSMASGYVSNKSTYYSCRAKRGKNITTIPHDEVIQVKHKTFDEKVWNGLTELLENPESMKEQLEKGLQDKREKIQRTHVDAEIVKELSKLSNQEKRILDAYRAEVISLEELKAQKEEIINMRKALEAKKIIVPSHTEGTEQPKVTMHMLGDVSARFERVMRKADYLIREKLTRLLVTSVILHPEMAVVSGNIPLIRADVLNLTASSR